MTRNAQKNQKGIHPETGRSTVEMLTVIVIGTILTLGCVWAIGYALNYVKANAIVSGAQTRIAAVDRRNIQRDVNKMDQVLKGFAKSDGQDYIYDIYPTSLHILTESEQSALEVPGPVLQVTGISNGVCRLLKRRTEAPMWINKQTQSAAVCHEDEDNIAWFELTLQPHVHEPDPPTCAGCDCGCNAGGCIQPITYKTCEGTSCVEKGCCPGDCPVDECETNAQCGGGQCTVGGTTYNDGASISECGKCNNGSIEVDTSKVPDCHECDTINYTLRKLTSSEKDSSGKCCVNGVRKYDSEMCPARCVVSTSAGATTYNDGDIIEGCYKCQNGSVEALATNSQDYLNQKKH